MSGVRLKAIIDEGRRLCEKAAANGVEARLLGGIGIHLRCPDATHKPELTRPYKDIDLVIPKRDGRGLRDLLIADGYTADTQFNAVHGATRMLFLDEAHERQLDVFLGTFEMCHTIELTPRLALPGPSLSPSDLLLLKLQIIELNTKDITDALTLLLQYMPVIEDAASTLSSGYIATFCAHDWGWYTTLHDNLETLGERAPGIVQSPTDLERIDLSIRALLAAMERAPKSMGWRLRDKVGRRKRWYELPEEVDL